MKKFVLNYHGDAIVSLNDEEEAPTNTIQYVPAGIAEKMLKALKETHSQLSNWHHDALPREQQKELLKMLKSIITKAEKS